MQSIDKPLMLRPRIPAAIILALGALSLAQAAPAQAQSSNQSDDITYRVEPGDTLYDLRREYLLGANSAAAIARYNRIRNPRRIPIGKELRLPRDLLAYKPARLRVRSFSGPVEIDGAVPQPGVEIAEGALVTTGARGFISFVSDAGSSISLPSNSRARLDRARIYKLRDLRDISFTILDGRGEVTVPSLKEGERFDTGTPIAVTAVRGTTFRVAHDGQSERSLTEVVEGKVSVANEAGETLATEGFGLAATQSGPGAPEELLSAVDVEDAGRVQTGEIVEFVLAPPQGAVASRTQIARDAGFLEIVAEEIGSDQQADFADLENGRYFVRSRAIAESGLEGFAEVYSFRRKRLGVSASVEESELEDAFKFAWLPEGEGSVLYAFQLWREGDQDRMLVDELAPAGGSLLLSGLEPGTYIWRVAAMQADEGDWLKVWGPEQRLNVSE